MTDAFFRAGVGAVVLDGSSRILTLRRKGAKDTAWQMPQGGIGFDEEPLEALHREMAEEVGLASDDFRVVKHTGWLTYEVPRQARNPKVGWGQIQQWFLCQLTTTPDAVRPDRIEFEAVRWVDAKAVVENAVAFRRELYRRLVLDFEL